MAAVNNPIADLMDLLIVILDTAVIYDEPTSYVRDEVVAELKKFDPPEEWRNIHIQKTRAEVSAPH